MKAAGTAIECGKLLSWKSARQDSPWSLSSSFPKGSQCWGRIPPAPASSEPSALLCPGSWRPFCSRPLCFYNFFTFFFFLFCNKKNYSIAADFYSPFWNFLKRSLLLKNKLRVLIYLFSLSSQNIFRWFDWIACITESRDCPPATPLLNTITFFPKAFESWAEDVEKGKLWCFP